MKKKIIMAGLVICLLLLCGGALLIFGNSVGISYEHAEKYTAGNTAVSGPVENLDVHWTSGRVNVEYHPGTDVIVSETADRSISESRQLRWWLDGTTLRIQYEESGFHFRLFDSLTKTLTVSLPEGTILKGVNIHATSGDLYVSGLDAEETSLTTTSGDVEASVKGGNLHVGATSGDLDIRAERCGNVSLSVTSGEIAAHLESAGAVSAGSTSGNITLTVTGRADSIRINATSGDVRLDAGQAGRAELDTTSGDVSLRLSAFSELDVDCTSGKVTAALPEEPGFTCQVKTSSGGFDSDIALGKDGSTYTCGDGSGKCSLKTTSGDIRIRRP